MTRAVHTKIGGSVAMLLLTTSWVSEAVCDYFRGSFSGYSVAGPRVLATGTSHSKRMFRGSFSGYSVASPRVLATYDQDRCVIYTNSVQSVARKGSGEGSHLISSLRERGSVHVEGEAFSMTQRKRLSPQ
ncbi:hypothetical protein J6590_040400 [Homalodisca vitripennis]|nr:hypothetical protein J6590_040400 [Homalodisca vitripennis]